MRLRWNWRGELLEIQRAVDELHGKAARVAAYDATAMWLSD
jgi:hypothetical protein